MRKRKQSTNLSSLLFMLLSIALLVWFSLGLQDLSQGQSQEGLQQLETALRRAAVSCYATEGKYPPSLEYLQEHYGVQIDQDKYCVYYNIFADNIMPDITVVENVS